MALRLARSLLVLLSGALLAGCDLVERIDAQAYRDYHASRWQATVDAFVREQATLRLPVEPPTPRVCADEMEAGYRRIVVQAEQSRTDWAVLDRSSRIAVQFVAEMLDVLVSRDTVQIEKLAPQIDRYVAEHAENRRIWSGQREAIARSESELHNKWAKVWPANDLDFDLAADAAALRSVVHDAPSDTRSAALSHYHENEYNRLAMIYLDFSPEVTPNPQSHVPAGCDGLSDALSHLEAGLMVRYSMDRAIEQNVTRIQELALVDLSQTPWEDIRIPQGRYARPRVTASIARLKLLKYLDTLLTDCLDVLVCDVEIHWRRVWPGHGLETSIFGYAGLPTTGELATGTLTDFTFRQ